MDELVKLYDEAVRRNFPVGDALYFQLKSFCNTDWLLDTNIQKHIKIYNYCKASKTPPYSTINDTPYEFIDIFLAIDNEVERVKIKAEEEANAKSKRKN